MIKGELKLCFPITSMFSKENRSLNYHVRGSECEGTKHSEQRDIV